MTRFALHDRVAWSWGRGSGVGRVEAIYTERVERVIKGTRVVRNATPENPAYLLRQENGGEVLKAHSELTLA
ncbi:MAG: DUF2945 domain-containing protein [Pseudomonadota bacterium]|nr:DUF2945 domain-containing protein [Pseudomonadota bacterium]MEE3101062.1 DUF2945 domain-containing protein [Pseudomonadota bacterium]